MQYLYAAFSLKDAHDGLAADEAAATARWRRVIGCGLDRISPFHRIIMPRFRIILRDSLVAGLVGVKP